MALFWLLLGLCWALLGVYWALLGFYWALSRYRTRAAGRCPGPEEHSRRARRGRPDLWWMVVEGAKRAPLGPF